MAFYCHCADQMRQAKLMGASNIWRRVKEEKEINDKGKLEKGKPSILI